MKDELKCPHGCAITGRPGFRFAWDCWPCTIADCIRIVTGGTDPEWLAKRAEADRKLVDSLVEASHGK